MLSMPMGMLFSKELTVKSSEQINHDLKKITFNLPEGDSQISGVPAGSIILTQHTPYNGWFPVFRPYTPISCPSDRGTLQLLVKIYPEGKASTYIHTMQPGDTISARGPFLGYAYTPCKTRRDLLFIAGGAGITPLFSLAQAILDDRKDKTRIQLLWAVNGTRDIVLRKELEEMEGRFPGRLQVTYAVSGEEGKPEAPSMGDESKFKKGYFSRDVLEEVIARCEKGRWGDAKGTKVWICGPPAMETAVVGKSGILMELGINAKEVHRF
ncbi:related to NADH-cytochrome b-5 reductase [Ramularia collo-cygni]|uniref:NADH-cytochrome b5 reductase 2 n=1 Tax=Ramularia collo-cygni TaxID=112498 RepID=A0A2D3V0T0_9PEZI|nr:related to NADH-cytochrome b-5 reductase [Ramularia collo-cygni]CZT15109.1 related to NADH-cytochrome b-5 reductase [Ramularia collo-cygni]